MTTHNQYFNMLCDMGELRRILTRSPDLDSFLHSMVTMVARHLETDVCSIYLYEDASQDLVLRATKGLNQEAVGSIRLAIGEGLVGTAVEELRAVLDNNAAQNPRFRAFPSAGEEGFEAFLAIPVIRGRETQSEPWWSSARKRPRSMKTMSSRSRSSRRSSPARLKMCSRLSTSKTRAPMSKPVGDRRRDAGYQWPRGPPQDFAYGGATLIEHGNVLSRKTFCAACPTNLVLDDFDRSVDMTTHQLQEIQTRLADQLPEMATMIFTAHQMMLMDNEFIGNHEAARTGWHPTASGHHHGLRPTTGKSSPPARMTTCAKRQTM